MFCYWVGFIQLIISKKERKRFNVLPLSGVYSINNFKKEKKKS